MDEKKDIEAVKQPSLKEALKNLFFVAAIIALAYYITVYVGIDDIRTTVESAGIYAPIIIILIKATTLIVVPIGGTIVYPVAGALYGFWQGLGIALVGDILGSTACFYISKIFGTKILRHFMTKDNLMMVEKIIDRVSDRKTFVKARIFFTGFPELFAYAAGFTKISFWFFLPLHVGIHAIGAALLVYFGEAIFSGSKIALVASGIVATVFALGGIWWFHSDLKKAS